MKHSICLTLCFCALVVALPTGPQVYRYEPAAKWITRPQRMMFMRYVQPHYARSSQAAALVAEDGVAASGTVLQDTEAVFGQELPQIPNDTVTDAQVDTTVETAVPSVDNVYIPAAEEQVPVQDANSKRDGRVYVELEPTAENEIPSVEQDTNVVGPTQEVANDDNTEVAPKVPARLPRPVARRPTKSDDNPVKPLPTGTFFPVDFGGVGGGAIAIAHSLSTDAGGAATSNAIAYGTPTAVESARFHSRRH